MKVNSFVRYDSFSNTDYNIFAILIKLIFSGHECRTWPIQDIFFGDADRALKTGRLLDGMKVTQRYLRTLQNYGFDLRVLNAAWQLLANSPLLNIEPEEMRRFYTDNISDVYKALKTDFTKSKSLIFTEQCTLIIVVLTELYV